jgi:acetyl-CoA C-acetyltransferase
MRERSNREVVVVEAVRTPFGKRGGGLSSMHSVDLLGIAQRAVIERASIDPAIVGQVIGGCVGQVGMQAMNVTRGAWLTAGLPYEVPATTVDTQCGSSQQATGLAYALIASGVIDVAIACGIEIMSRVTMGSTVPKDPDVGKAINKNYWSHYEFTTQFEAAERIADKWGVSRSDCDEFGLLSQQRAAEGWANGRFDSQLVPVQLPDGTTMVRDEGMRDTTLDGLRALKPTGRVDGVHTAGTSSQIADGASSVLLMAGTRAKELGLAPLATVVDVTLVGCDPVLMLEGPIPATRKLLIDNQLSMTDIDIVEINEAFASVVLAWERELQPNMAAVNPNGGAIALGHPLGATGCALLTKAIHELTRSGGKHALVTMCCGGGLGTATLLRTD